MIYLASISPRRRALLQKAGLRYVSVRPSYKEDRGVECRPTLLARRHALGKAMSAIPRVRNGIVLGADTVVFFDGKIFGKPKNMPHAFKMLSTLSGHWHVVMTAVALLKIRRRQIIKQTVFVEKTRVKLRKMDHKALRGYLKRIRPMDKAGAYALQSGEDSIVQEICGSRTNGVGLPIERLKMKLNMLK
jgi:septum formation protein